jgi:gluconate 2-dehydrogenase gamma chain
MATGARGGPRPMRTPKSGHGCPKQCRAEAMSGTARSRRRFLAEVGSGLGVGWLSSQWPAIAAAHAHAAAAVGAAAAQKLGFLTPIEARDVEAVAAQIVPTDDTPGAREAGALFFIDRSLSTWASAAAEPFRSGLRDFRERFTAEHPNLDYADASAEVQISFLADVDQTDFFKKVRFLTLLGLFASPRHGGNREGIGWTLIGFDDRHAFTPPFGYYDRDYPGFTIPDSQT